MEPAPLGPCLMLVADSIKERREREDAIERKRMIQEAESLAESQSLPSSTGATCNSPKVREGKPKSIFSTDSMLAKDNVKKA